MPTDPPAPAERDPVSFVFEEMLGFVYPAALRAVIVLGVPEQLAGGPSSPAELAELTGADEGFLHRTLRLLATKSVFRQDESGLFHLTPRADVLRRDSPRSAAAAVLSFTADFVWTPTHSLAESLRSGTRAFDGHFGTSFFDYFAQNSEQGEVFDEGLVSFSLEADELCAASYEFPESGLLVDVGGGRGGLLLAVLRRYPGMRGVLHDRPNVLAGHVLGELGQDHRWETAAGDFFENVPAGADFYALKYILHDWEDAVCVQLLRRCRDATAPGGRVLVIDLVLPAGNVAHLGKTMDVLMMVLLPGKERTAADFERLFREAGLRLSAIIPTGGPLSVVEGVPE